MSDTVIHIDNISKKYRLGLVGTQTLRGDLQSWWYRIRGKEDPTLKIGEENRLDKQDGEYVWALRDINFEVKQGEVLGIIGKNGAGKSTLLKIISRITAPTSGSIKVKGRIASLLEVGTGFHGELTGRENIFLNGAILGMKKWEIQQKFDEIVDFAGVAKYIDTPVKRYSSGMYVRLAFAVAAHLEPEILIVDEVLAVGDAEFQKKAIGKMQDISSGSGRTVLFVSHNLTSIQALCPQSILLSQGRIVFSGNSNDVINMYSKNNQNTISIDKIHFDGPLNQFIELNSATINGLNPYTHDVKVFKSKQIEFKIEYTQLTKLNVKIILAVFKNDIRLFNLEENEHAIGTTQGKYQSQLILPGNILNIGNHNIALGMLTNDETKHWLWKLNVFGFEIMEDQLHSSYNDGVLSNPSIKATRVSIN